VCFGYFRFASLTGFETKWLLRFSVTGKSVSGSCVRTKGQTRATASATQIDVAISTAISSIVDDQFGNATLHSSATHPHANKG
jgi:hypothetical protein